MTEEERKKLEAKGLEEQKKKAIEEVVEKIPEWQIYCILKQDDEQKKQYNNDVYLEEFEQAYFWKNMIA